MRTTKSRHECINIWAGFGLLSYKMCSNILYAEGLRAISLGRRQGFIMTRVECGSCKPSHLRSGMGGMMVVWRGD